MLIQEENILEKYQITELGADRVQSGMRNAFGKAISVEALVKTNQKIMSIDVNPKNFQDAKTALKRAGMKMPVSCRIVIEKGADLVK